MEFTYLKNIKSIHIFNQLCDSLNIRHQFIIPHTPRHKVKVLRDHRNGSERFYRFLSFYSYDDLKIEMNVYLKRSNNIPMQTLNWLSPIQMRNSLSHDRLPLNLLALLVYQIASHFFGIKITTLIIILKDLQYK